MSNNITSQSIVDNLIIENVNKIENIPFYNYISIQYAPNQIKEIKNDTITFGISGTEYKILFYQLKDESSNKISNLFFQIQLFGNSIMLHFPNIINIENSQFKCIRQFLDISNPLFIEKNDLRVKMNSERSLDRIHKKSIIEQRYSFNDNRLQSIDKTLLENFKTKFSSKLNRLNHKKEFNTNKTYFLIDENGCPVLAFNLTLDSTNSSLKTVKDLNLFDIFEIDTTYLYYLEFDFVDFTSLSKQQNNLIINSKSNKDNKQISKENNNNLSSNNKDIDYSLIEDNDKNNPNRTYDGINKVFISKY